MTSMKHPRQFLKNDAWEQWETIERDQKMGVQPPRMQQPYPPQATLVDLIAPEAFSDINMTLIDAIGRRRSCREFTDEPLTLEELSFLLWATQGVHTLLLKKVFHIAACHRRVRAIPLRRI